MKLLPYFKSLHSALIARTSNTLSNGLPFERSSPDVRLTAHLGPWYQIVLISPSHMRPAMSPREKERARESVCVCERERVRDGDGHFKPRRWHRLKQDVPLRVIPLCRTRPNAQRRRKLRWLLLFLHRHNDPLIRKIDVGKSCFKTDTRKSQAKLRCCATTDKNVRKYNLDSYQY